MQCDRFSTHARLAIAGLALSLSHIRNEFTLGSVVFGLNSAQV
jgi:hypothetical protein